MDNTMFLGMLTTMHIEVCKNMAVLALQQGLQKETKYKSKSIQRQWKKQYKRKTIQRQWKKKQYIDSGKGNRIQKE